MAGETEASTPTTTASSSGHLSSWSLGIVITCLFFGAFLIALDTNIVNVAIPKISSEFHSLGDVAWYGTAYLLTITAFQPIYGSLYKFFSTDVVYRISILIFEGKHELFNSITVSTTALLTFVYFS